jgi:hypothetical protein
MFMNCHLLYGLLDLAVFKVTIRSNAPPQPQSNPCNQQKDDRD